MTCLSVEASVEAELQSTAVSVFRLRLRKTTIRFETVSVVWISREILCNPKKVTTKFSNYLKTNCKVFLFIKKLRVVKG